MRRAIICFTRVPVPGQTKTRLMPRLTGEQCAGLHRAFLRDLSRAFAQVDADLYIAYTPEGGEAALRELFPAARALFPQRGEDLGSRMEGALDRVLALGYGACVLVGADLPLLSPGHLEAAFAALERAEVTLGPTPDGGYYLVGLRRPCPCLFAGQVYGVGTVYEQALSALRRAGASFAPLPPCADVDTPEDLAALWWALRGRDTATAHFLEKLVQGGGAPRGSDAVSEVCDQ